MNPNDWKLEMNRMLDSFANQAEFSLGKINQCFVSLGRPFDDDFRKYYLEMSNQRLDMSFKTILFSNGTVRNNETEAATINPNSAKKPSLNSLKIENDDDLIEICDSDDDSYSDTQQVRNNDGMQHDTVFGNRNGTKPIIEAEFNRGNMDGSAEMIEINDSDGEEDSKVHLAIVSADDGTEINENIASMVHTISNQSLDDTRFGSADLNGENEVNPLVKDESISDNSIEMVDIPLVVFDPNKGNDNAIAVNEKGESSKTHQSNTSSNIKTNQSKRNVSGKRLKCKHCKCTFQYNSDFERHQKLHANKKLIGVKADSSGLYHCSQCVRKFRNVNHLSKHMKSHKNDSQSSAPLKLHSQPQHVINTFSSCTSFPDQHKFQNFLLSSPLIRLHIKTDQ